ncbi:hypothetical protein BDV93DRAFT_505986 [Ceratobasidium sp. AG-I]|nr:hypothetical protein BDV93DRAFT_505986 [Ceratobasidium sp. AG-I]
MSQPTVGMVARWGGSMASKIRLAVAIGILVYLLKRRSLALRGVYLEHCSNYVPLLAAYATSLREKPNCPHTIFGVKPGTYTATLFKKELEVETASVTVSAGKAAMLNMYSSESLTGLRLYYCEWMYADPRYSGNASKIETMHPADSHMSAWGAAAFATGGSSPASSPMSYNPTTIKWATTFSQIGARTLRIRITWLSAALRSVVIMCYRDAHPSHRGLRWPILHGRSKSGGQFCFSKQWLGATRDALN